MAENEKDEQPKDEQAKAEQPGEEAAVQSEAAGEETAPAGEAEAGEEKDNLPPVEVDVQDLGALRRKLIITVPAERIAARRDEAVKQLSGNAQVPGFRIGRAPRRLIEKRFGLEMSRDVKMAMVVWGYTEAIKKAELKVLGEPPMDQERLDAIKLPDEGPMTFDVEVEVQPEFELPELTGIPVTRPSAEVTDQDIELAMKRLQGNFAKLEIVQEPAKADDVLSADVTFEVEGGQKHEHVGQNVAVRPQALEGVPLENLGEKLTGATAGQTVTVETTVPEGHPTAEIRGKKATFTFKVHQVKRVRLPEMDDAFAKQLGFEKLEGVREWVRERLAAESQIRQRQMMRGQVAEYLLTKAQFELPEGALGQLRDRVLARRANELMMQGVPRAELEKHVDELAVRAGEEATRELRMLFIMAKVADKLDVQVTEPEVNSLIAQLAAQYNRRPDSLREDLEKRDAMGSLVAQIREQKAIDLLLEDAKIEDAKPAGEEPKPEASGAGEAPKAE